MNPKAAAAAQTKANEARFDLNTHKRDKFGKIVEVRPYRLHFIGGEKAFEWPVGSKNLWFENNEPAGRLIETVDEKTGKKAQKFDFTAAHIEYTAPLGLDEQAALEMSETKAQNAALIAELAALKAEQAAAIKQSAAPAAKAQEAKK